MPSGASGEVGPRCPLTPEALIGGPRGPGSHRESPAALGQGFTVLKNQSALMQAVASRTRAEKGFCHIS